MNVDCLISVVIPCFNAADFLADAVRSVVAQRIPGTEILIVDDCSSDHSTVVVETLVRQYPGVQLLRQRVNEGPAFARNRGLRLARGRYVCFLDADDEYAPNFFAEALSILENDNRVAGTTCEVELVNCHREVDPIQLSAMVGSLPSNLLVRRTIADLVGGFPEHAAFYRKTGGEDVIFRSALRQWFRIVLLDGKYLRYRVRRGASFDRFLENTKVVDGELVFTGHSPEVLSGQIAEANKLYRDEIGRRVSTLASLQDHVQSC